MVKLSNEIIVDNFPNCGEDVDIHVQETYRHDKKRSSS